MKKDSSTLSSYNIDSDVISKIARLFARQNGVNISFSEVQEPIINKNSIIIPSSCKKWAKDPEKVSLFRGFLDLQIWKLRTSSLIQESFKKKEKVTPSQDLLNAFIRKSKTYNKLNDTVNVEDIKFRIFNDAKTPDLSLGTEESFKKFVSDPSIVPALKYIFDIFEVVRIENWAGRSSFLGVKQNIQSLHAHTFMNRKKFDSEIMESLIQMALSVYFKSTLDWINFKENTKFSDMSSTWIDFYNPYFAKLANELKYSEDSYNLAVSLLLSCFEQFEAPDLSDPPPPDSSEDSEDSEEETEDGEDNKDSKDKKDKKDKDSKDKKDQDKEKKKDKESKDKKDKDKQDSEKKESSEDDSDNDESDSESDEEGDGDESEDGEKQESDESSSSDAEEGQSDAQDQKSDSSEDGGEENGDQEGDQEENSENSENGDPDDSDSGNEDSQSDGKNEANSQPKEKKESISKKDLEKLIEELKKAQEAKAQKDEGDSEEQGESEAESENSEPGKSNYGESSAEKQKNKPLKEKDVNGEKKEGDKKENKEYEPPKFDMEELKKAPSAGGGKTNERQLSDTMQIFTDQEKAEKTNNSIKQKAIYGAPPEVLQNDRVIQIKEVDEKRFKHLKDTVGKRASVVSNKMKNIIRVLAEEDEEYDKQYGDLDEDSLAEVATKNHAIYYKTNQGTNHNNIAWFFLVDLSGSMGGHKCELAIQSLLTCCQAIYDAGNNKFFVAGFDNGSYGRYGDTGHSRESSSYTQGIFSRRDSMNIYLVKKFSDDWNKVKKTISSLRAGGNNGDGDALKWAISRLLEVENVSRRELIVFSDGEPSCGSDGYGLLHEDLIQTVKRGRELGIGINSVGIMHNTSRFYGEKNSLVINKIDELPEKFTKMIRSVMLGPKSLTVKKKGRKYN